MAVEWEFRRQTVLCSEALLRILHQALVSYDNDLESTVIYLAVVCGTVGGAVRDPRLAATPPPPGRMAPQLYRSVSRRQIAASTGLPRETVRRKIAEFLERGDLVADGVRVQMRPGLLEDPHNFEFAQTMRREFARAGAQVTAAGDPDRVASD